MKKYTPGNPEKFLTTQHERDQETGFDYRGARFYDSDIARFLSTDPWQTKYPAWSTYNYVMGNPLIFIDPTGKGSESTHIDENGKVIAVFNDGDKSIYQHENNADGKSPTEYMIAKRQGKHGTSANGKKVGETETWDQLKPSDWYTPASQINTAIGTATSIGSIAGDYRNVLLYQQGFRKGVNGTYQLTGRNYNLFKNSPMKPHTMPVSGWSKFGRGFGLGSLGAGLVMDVIGMWIYKDNPNSPNAVHPAKAGLNAGMGVMGLGVNPVGSGLYFGVDAFHTDGWQGFMKNTGDLNRELQQSYGPNFRLVPFGPK